MRLPSAAQTHTTHAHVVYRDASNGRQMEGALYRVDAKGRRLHCRLDR